MSRWRSRRSGVTGLLLAAALAVALLYPATSAAVEFGDPCGATDFTESLETAFQFSAPEDPLSSAAPISGVITSWKVDLENALVGEAVPVTMQVVRPDLASRNVAILAEASAVGYFGANSFPARIPIQAGDHLALYGGGEPHTPFCKTGGAIGSFGGFGGSAPVGAVHHFEATEVAARIPVAATVEPDVDGDGYGDETQDACPRSAAVHLVPCPEVTLGASARALRNAALVLVSTSSTAPVTVSGVVGLGHGRTAQLAAPVQQVAPGQLAQIRLAFPAGLKKRLARLAPHVKLKLRVTVSATDSLGVPSSAALTAVLHGQKKAAKKRGHRKPKPGGKTGL